jgi:hypothetical protein
MNLPFINVSLIHDFVVMLSFNFTLKTSGLYYKPMMIVHDDSRVINKLEASLTDNARVIIYDCHMFIVQAKDYTG